MIADLLLGTALGMAAGAVFRPAFHAAWRWGWALPGPIRADEAARPGHVAPRAALRASTALVASCATSAAVLLALTLPARSIVGGWPRFLAAWLIGFSLSAGIAAIARRRPAT